VEIGQLALSWSYRCFACTEASSENLEILPAGYAGIHVIAEKISLLLTAVELKPAQQGVTGIHTGAKPR